MGINESTQVHHNDELTLKKVKRRLSKAASDGNVDVVSSILERFGTTDFYFIETIYPVDIASPLLAACRTGQLEVVRILVAKIRSYGWHEFQCLELERHYYWIYHETPLSAAAKKGEVDKFSIGPALVTAIHDGHYEAVNVLLNCGVPIDINMIPMPYGCMSRSPLEVAIRGGHANLVQLLLDNSAHVNTESLVLACEEGHSDIARLLIQRGAKVNGTALWDPGKSPLAAAAGKGHAECVWILLENGADVDAEVMLAVTNRHLDYVQIMLAYNEANMISISHTVLYSALLQACKEGHMGCFRLLIDCGIWNVNGEACDKTVSSSCSSKYPFGMPPLLAACQAGQLEVMRALLKYKDIQINFAFENETPLSAAIKGGYSEIIKMLLEHNIDVNYVGEGEQVIRSPLYVAMYNGNYELTVLLLQNFNINLGISSTGETLIMIAAQNGHVNVVKFLLLKGAEVHSRSPHNVPSALTQACKEGHTECARLLIQHGGNVSEESEEGTPLTCAAENGHTECVKLLVENGADVNRKNSLHYTPLMLASQNDHAESAWVLLEHGARVNKKAYGDSAYTLARRYHNFKTLDVLKQYGAVGEDSESDSDYDITNDSEEKSGLSETEDEMIDADNSSHVQKSEKGSEKDSLQEDRETNIDNVKHLAAVEKAMQEKGILKHTLAHGVLAGPARSGKSSLMKRLTGEMPDSTSPSTGVAEQVVQVGVKQSYSVALGVYDSIWFKLLYDEEAIRLITLASHATPPPPPQPQVTDSSVKAVKVPSKSGIEHIVIHPHEEQERILSTTASTASLFPTGYIAPMRVFKNAMRGKGLEGLREHFENSWSLYLTDTGGQAEFQELLPLLVSGPSIFFLTFCLHQDLNKRFTIEYHLPDGGRSEPYQSTLTVMESILQTLASIASMGSFTYKGPQKDTVQVKPKVFIVGTHKDLLDQDKVDTEIQRIDHHIQTAIKSTSHYQEDLVEFASKSQLIFTVNNLSKDVTDFVVIRAAVERVVNRSKFEISFPSNWLIFSLVLRQEMIKDSVISYDQCFAIAQDCGITDREELNHALQFLHTKIGLVRHFPIPDLHDIVIRYPQILFDMVTKLIVNTFTFENVCQRKLTEFEKKGIFTIEDLSQIEQFSIPLLPLEKLLKLLEHLRIVAPFEEGKVKKYFIPCVLAHSKQGESQSSTQSSDVPPLLITFKCGYCPKGVPGTLIKYLITNEMRSKFKWKLMTDQIFRDQVTFGVSPYDAITLKIHPTYLEVIHFRTSTPKQARKVTTVCKSVLQSIESGITQVSSDMKLSSYAKHFLSFYCNNSECNNHSKEPHPATEICKNEDGSMCNLWCTKSGKVLQSPLPHGCLVWFGKERQKDLCGHLADSRVHEESQAAQIGATSTRNLSPSTESLARKQSSQGQPMIARRDVIPVVKWNLKTLHSKGVIGSGVVIAILDGGLDIKHSLIDESTMYPPNSANPYCSLNYIHSQQQLYTQHATAVAAVAGCLRCNDKTPAGIAPGAQLVVCRISDDKDCYYVDAIRQALTELRDLKRNGQQIDIICMSFCIDRSEDIEELLSDLAREKVICIAAAGNDGSAQHGAYFPASDPNVLSVGALTPGAKVSDITPDSGIDVYAYGEDIVVPTIGTTNQTCLADGTSFAAPMVAGFLALLLQCVQMGYPLGTPLQNIVRKYHDVKFLKLLFNDHRLCKDKRLIYVDEFFKPILKQIKRVVPSPDEHLAVEIIRKYYTNFNP